MLGNLGSCSVVAACVSCTVVDAVKVKYGQVFVNIETTTNLLMF